MYTCKVWDDAEAQLLDLTDIGAQSSVHHGQHISLDILSWGLLQQQVHPLHEDQQDLDRLHHLHDWLQAGQHMIDIVSFTGIVCYL